MWNTQNVVDAAECYDFNKGYVDIDYEGSSVFQALNETAGLDLKDMLENEDINWLPKPLEYEYDTEIKSYFNMEGYGEFKSRVLPIVKKYLDEGRLHIEYKEHVDEMSIVYSDEFQIVVKKASEKFQSFYEILMKNMEDTIDSDPFF